MSASAVADQVCNCSPVSVADWISIAIAGVALLFAVLNYLKYRELQREANDLQEKSNDLQRQSNELQDKANKMSDIQTLTAQGALESQLRAAISDAYMRIAEMAVTLAKDPGNEELQRIYKSTEELYRNAYEDACDKYLEGKVDTDSFKTMYYLEIKRLVDEKPHSEVYASNRMIYKCTLKVHEKWFGKKK